MAGTTRMPTPEDALPGRELALRVPEVHYVSGRRMTPPYPEGLEVIELGAGCFWGAERRLWGLPGVWVTAVGYAGGYTPNPTYQEVCTGRTGHAEVVRVVFDPRVLALERLLAEFWEMHDPTQGMRQGNDVGTQYRSIILVHDDEQRQIAERSRERYQQALRAHGRGRITTSIEPAGPFYFAEGYHQQYLAKNPGGYCGLGGTGVPYPALAV